MVKEYIRDGRAPVPEKEVTSMIMSRIKGKDTKPELLLRKRLWNSGIRGYRVHWKKAPGNPDICFVGKKIAVFVNGCFWHRCPYCKLKLPKSHSAYWKEKFGKNVERDKRYQRELRQQGWKSITLWECKVKKNTEKCINKVNNALNGL